MSRHPALSSCPCLLIKFNQVPVSLGTLMVTSLQGWMPGPSPKRRRWSRGFAVAPGTHPVLTCVFAPTSWVHLCQECRPPPSPVTVEILPALSRLNSDANLCPPKPCEPSHPHPHSDVCPLLPLVPYLFPSGDKFCLLCDLSWHVACHSC